MRISGGEISNLLSNDFLEFCSTGSVYQYHPGDVFRNCPAQTDISEFSVRELSRNYALATYRAVIDGRASLRSSLWKLEEEGWKVFFHQGTPVSDARLN